jgi:hypothetical protein
MGLMLNYSPIITCNFGIEFRVLNFCAGAGTTALHPTVAGTSFLLLVTVNKLYLMQRARRG